MTTIREFQQVVHHNAKAKGFHPAPRNRTEENWMIAAKLCLIHSEVSEALEALRTGDIVGMGEELADIVIRTLDLAEWCGVDLQKRARDKHEQNKKRKHKHGKLL